MQCIAINDTEWENQTEKACQKLPSIIEVLSLSNCQELEVDGVSSLFCLYFLTYFLEILFLDSQYE